ncbi:MAG: outer membrane protein assembly factor BamD [Candidatus Eisenbacteria bacterium]
MKRLSSLVLLALLAGCGGSVLPQVHDEGGRLELARRLYAKGDATLAVEVLAPFSTSGSGSGNVDEAVYLLGLCHLKLKDWLAAQGDFERLQRDYPESDSAASAVFRRGEALWGQSRGPDFDQEFTLKALEQWMTFRREHPGHWLAPEATRRIAEARFRLATKLYRTGDLYVKLKDYGSARSYFRNVLTEYSESTLYGDALIGWAVATARLGQRDSALTVLREFEAEYAGQPAALKSARTREAMAKWRLDATPKRRHTTPNEPPPATSPGGVNGLTP